jgi:hypothetical protein
MKPSCRSTRAKTTRHLFSQAVSTLPALPVPDKQALTVEVARLLADTALRRAAMLREDNRER